MRELEIMAGKELMAGADMSYEVISNITEMAKSYGLYASFVNYKNGASPLGKGPYLVFQTTPISENVNPYEIYQKVQRDPLLFYPNEFAVPINPDNLLGTILESIEYCKHAEFLSVLYKEFNAELPDRIRHSELAGLVAWASGRYDETKDSYFRSDCIKGLKNFFKNEKSAFGQERRSFFRSSKYALKSSKWQRSSDFNNRHSSIVRLEVLLEGGSDFGIKKVGIGEFEGFCNHLKTFYPEVLISVSEKEIIDLGLFDYAKRNPDVEEKMGQRFVTDKEFFEIIEDRFAKEGFDCTNDLQPVYFEYYDVYYKKADEPSIIAAYNDVYLRFAKAETIDKISEKGDMTMTTIPVDMIHSFVAHAKAARIPFYIDHRGVFSEPSFSDIHVIYNVDNRERMNEVVNNVMLDEFRKGHILPEQMFERKLDDKIQQANQHNLISGGGLSRDKGYDEKIR